MANSRLTNANNEKLGMNMTEVITTEGNGGALYMMPQLFGKTNVLRDRSSGSYTK